MKNLLAMVQAMRGKLLRRAARARSTATPSLAAPAPVIVPASTVRAGIYRCARFSNLHLKNTCIALRYLCMYIRAKSLSLNGRRLGRLIFGWPGRNDGAEGGCALGSRRCLLIERASPQRCGHGGELTEVPSQRARSYPAGFQSSDVECRIVAISAKQRRQRVENVSSLKVTAGLGAASPLGQSGGFLRSREQRGDRSR
jgi:hypothetical protein